MTAARDATRRMIDWLGPRARPRPDRGLPAVSVAVDLRISEIVDHAELHRHGPLPAAIFE